MTYVLNLTLKLAGSDIVFLENLPVLETKSNYILKPVGHYIDFPFKEKKTKVRTAMHVSYACSTFEHFEVLTDQKNFCIGF